MKREAKSLEEKRYLDRICPVCKGIINLGREEKDIILDGGHERKSFVHKHCWINRAGNRLARIDRKNNCSRTNKEYDDFVKEHLNWSIDKNIVRLINWTGNNPKGILNLKNY